MIIAWPSRPLLALVALLGLAAGPRVWAQPPNAEILLPGDEYHQSELPSSPAGDWWVLHRPDGETRLERLAVVVTPFRTCGDEEPSERSGRAVRVPAAFDPVLLVRGDPALVAGTVRTVFLDDGDRGRARRVEVRWDDRAVVVRHLTEDPSGDQPGEYRIDLTVAERRSQLHVDQWHGDGHWRVRWIGDLNRDGWPDLLVDASYKYSVHTTRLFLSRRGAGGFEIVEAATFTHSAC